MHYVVQEGLKEEIKFDRYRDAVAKFKELILAEPKKKAGLFLMGDSSAVHWHFGDFGDFKDEDEAFKAPQKDALTSSRT